MRQVLMIVTKEGCREMMFPKTASSFSFYIANENTQEEKISLYQKEGRWSFRANVKGFLKLIWGNTGESFCVGEQKMWEYIDKTGKRIVFLTFGKKQEETRFQYYIAGETEEITIGKNKENTISYDCMGLMSSLHAVVKWTGGDWKIYDKSKNGIFLEGKRIYKQKKLTYGDCIEVFGLKIVFFGRILGIEKREPLYVRMEKHYWWEPDVSQKEVHSLGDGVEVLSLIDKELSDGGYKKETKITTISLEGNGETQRERRGQPTLFFAIGPIKMLYDGKGRKTKKAYEEQEFARWKAEQKAKIMTAYEEEEKRWRKENGSILEWLDSDNWREEVWQQANADTLWLTLGIGKRKSELVYSMEQVTCKREKEELKKWVKFHEWHEQVPVGVDFFQCKQLEIVGETAWKMLQGMLIQIAIAIPYTKLRIVCLAKTENTVARDIRWLPHVWAKDQEYRYYATNKEQVPSLFSKLEKEEMCHTLVLVEERTWLDEIEWQYTYGEKGYSFWFLVDKQKNNSGLCGQRLIIEKEGVTFFREGRKEQEFAPQYLNEKKWKSWLQKINRLRVGKRQQIFSGEIGLFQIYTREKREKRAILKRWSCNQTSEGICAYLGVDEKETPVILNIQEKQQGPHGLIAGTTGAGKSILLQTFVLSLAMEYSPKQLQFVLIDYKGGDMATPLRELPHVVGTLTNLRPQLLRRGLSAIQSEIERRQQLLAEKQLSHIDCYNEQMESGNEKAVPHLCVVVDEFAELTTAAPYFLEGLLKVSRVGRSLGIHLILATQKPEGTITPHIWTNSRFRLCLMVQSEKDSLEMLRRKDAATITVPGEAFLQVGTENVGKKIRVAHAGALVEKESCVTCLLEDGTKVEKAKEETNIHTQREELVGLLVGCAKDSGIEKQNLWMPLLSDRIAHTQSQNWKNNGMYLGWCDIPKKQKQMPLLIEERQLGNMAVLGEVGRGKTTCLKTIIWELTHNFLERKQWIFLCDFDGEFGKEEKVPWTGAIVRNETEFEKVLYFLVGEYEKRRKNWNPKTPMLWVCIDSMETMRKQTRDGHMEELSMLIREGKKYGIAFVVLAQSYGLRGIPSTWKKNMVHQLVFSKDCEERRNCYPQKELPESTSSCPGRGITKIGHMIVEFQGVYVEEETYHHWLLNIPKEEKEMPFVLLPEILDYSMFRKMEKACQMQDYFSIGCRELDGSVFPLPLQGLEHFLLVGKKEEDLETPLCTFLLELKRKKVPCLLIGKSPSKTVKFAEKHRIPVIWEMEWEEEKLPIETNGWVFVEDFLSWVKNNGDWMFEMMQKKKEITWVAVCKAEEFRLLRKYPAFRYMAEGQQGIYIGSGIREQSFFDTGILPRTWENYMSQQEIGLAFFYKKMQLVHFPNISNGEAELT